MLTSSMSRRAPRKEKASPRVRQTASEDLAAAVLALKAHALACDPEILADLTDGDRVIQEIADTVNLTEAPEDAVCSLVIDLMQYCEREKIGWTEDVMSRAWKRFRPQRTEKIQIR